MAQIYCSVSEVLDELGETGKTEKQILEKIQSASNWILQHIGQFLPEAGSKSAPEVEREGCGANADGRLMTPPLLSASAVTVYGTARTGWSLWPFDRMWANGPYCALQVDEDLAAWWGDESGSNVITGTWGMYDEAVSVALSAVSQGISDTTLTVSDGSLVSPGMVLKIDSEWELVTSSGVAANSGASLAGACDDSSEEITITTGTMVHAGELVKVDFEAMRILDVNDRVMLVARGVNNTKKASHNTGTVVKAFRSPVVTRGANGSTAAAHTSAAVYRQVAPADVNYLARQMASLMLKKGMTGFAGRGGNDEMGTGFWISEFPKSVIEAVKGNYPWMGY